MDMPPPPTSSHWCQYYDPQPLDTKVDRQSVDSQNDPEYSNQRSRPQTPSILLTSPESDLADANLPSLAEDFQTYAQLMVHMAKFLDLQIHCPSTEPTDHLYDPISKSTTTPVHISMLLSLLSTAQQSWTKPASSHTMSKWVDNLYRIHDPRVLFLQKHQLLIPYLLMLHNLDLDITRPSYQIRTVGESTPWVDGFICRQHSPCKSLIIKEPWVQRFLWDNMTTFVESLPEDKKLLAQTFQQEGLSVAKQQMLSARHIVDVPSKSMATSVAL